MNTSPNREKKILVPVRLAPSVKDFLDQKAADESIATAALYRKVIYAGIQSLFGIKVRNHQIIE